MESLTQYSLRRVYTVGTLSTVGERRTLAHAHQPSNTKNKPPVQNPHEATIDDGPVY